MLKDITDFNLLDRNVRERAGSGGYDQDPSLKASLEANEIIKAVTPSDSTSKLFS